MTVGHGDHQISQQKINSITVLLDALTTELDFTVEHSSDQKSRMLRTGTANMAFARLMTKLTREHGGILPQAVDFSALERDLALYDALETVKIKLAPIVENINDTQTAAGADAYQTALKLYGVAKALDLQGMEEAQRQMSERFSNSGNRTPRTAKVIKPNTDTQTQR